jgi:methyl-accepting chemotaxis protein
MQHMDRIAKNMGSLTGSMTSVSGSMGSIRESMQLIDQDMHLMSRGMTNIDGRFITMTHNVSIMRENTRKIARPMKLMP